MLDNGTRVQYRKVGRGTVASHTCPRVPYACGPDTGSHQYDVAFETGRYRGDVVAVWLADTARIEAQPKGRHP
jgi:hypothetical protein